MQSSSFRASTNGSLKAFGNRFRIVCLQANGSIALLTFCQTLSQARLLARKEVDQHLARLRSERLAVLLDAKRPAQICVQQWVGEATSGAWKVVDRREGGYDFTFYDSPPRKFRSQNGQAANAASKPTSEAFEKSPSPQSGDLVECVLLEKRTRKGGWFAKIKNLTISGPITGAAPADRKLAPGITIVLRVCSCKPATSTAQFAWH